MPRRGKGFKLRWEDILCKEEIHWRQKVRLSGSRKKIAILNSFTGWQMGEKGRI